VGKGEEVSSPSKEEDFLILSRESFVSVKLLLAKAKRLMEGPYSDLESLGFLPNRPYDDEQGGEKGVVSEALRLMDDTMVVSAPRRGAIIGFVEEFVEESVPDNSPDVEPEGEPEPSDEPVREGEAAGLGQAHGGGGEGEGMDEWVKKRVSGFAVANFGREKRGARYSVRIVVGVESVKARCTCPDGEENLNPCPHKVAVLAKAIALELDAENMDEIAEDAHMMLSVFTFENAVKAKLSR
jgi:hypothetical protein